MNPDLSTEAQNLNWLVTSFVDRVPGVSDAAVVSSDGLLIAMSEGLQRAAADRLAAVAAGLVSIARGVSTPIGAGHVNEVIIEFDNALLLTMRVSDSAVLAVITGRPCDIGQIGYEMAMLVDQTAVALSPRVVNELQTALPR